MDLHVRDMRLEETPLAIDYFHSSTPEHWRCLELTRYASPKGGLGILIQIPVRPSARRAESFLRHLVDGWASGWILKLRQDNIRQAGKYEFACHRANAATAGETVHNASA